MTSAARVAHSGSMNEPERTEDGRYIVVDGRRWRASDPGIPPKLRQELVDELMAARRLVRSDPASARPRVHDAKNALGERGYEWWREPSADELRTRIEATIRSLLAHRAGSSICPSDVARIVGADGWRDLMPTVREVAFALRAAGQVEIMQGGEPAVEAPKGPIRIAPSAPR